jgi:hypothetical protein
LSDFEFKISPRNLQWIFDLPTLDLGSSFIITPTIDDVKQWAYANLGATITNAINWNALVVSDAGTGMLALSPAPGWSNFYGSVTFHYTLL